MGGAIGGIFQTIGDQRASSAEARAHKANAQWFAEQAEFARLSTQRELRIFDRDAKEFYGEQVSGIARGGIDLSGSPLLVLAQTKMEQFEERRAIEEMGAIQYKEASTKASISAGQAKATREAAKYRAIGSAFSIWGSAFTGGFKAGRS